MWITIHLAYSFASHIYNLALHIYAEYVRIPKSYLLQKPASFQTDKELIENVKTIIQKLPKHILVILGDEKLTFECMANLVCWSIFAGVNCISFYDYKGMTELSVIIIFVDFIKEMPYLYVILYRLYLDKPVTE